MSSEHKQKLENSLTPEKIFELCIRKLDSLPRTGKPNETEWTVLSCIVEFNEQSNQAKVVSLGTGTKCIGQDQMCSRGLTLNDSHAEVMARRGFLRYLYYNMQNSQNSKLLTYCKEKRKFHINDEISFHFLSTHAPCGDATIVSKITENEGIDEPNNKRLKLSEESNDNFTGAKLLSPGTKTDLMSQDEGALRLKPGRGVRTLSMSCSDKLSRWNILGIQGALIDVLLNAPIYLKTFNFCGNVDKNSLARAIYERFSKRKFSSTRYKVHTPVINICSPDLSFKFMQKCDKDPSSASIAWCDIKEKPLEVTVSGKRQGVTKSKRNLLSAALRISKQWLFQEFHALVSIQPDLLGNLPGNDVNFSEISYGELKNLCIDYQYAWQFLKDNYFMDWTKKHKNILNFKLE